MTAIPVHAGAFSAVRQPFLVNQRDVRATAQELKRFEEIHPSTQRCSALAAAIALPAQGRGPDRLWRPVPVPDNGIVDLRSE